MRKKVLMPKIQRLGMPGLKKELSALEKKYKIPTEEFLHKLEHGEMDDRLDFMRWLGLAEFRSATRKAQGQLRLARYFKAVHNLLGRYWSIGKKKVVYKTYSANMGEMVGKFFLLDGSFVDFSEQILIVDETIAKQRYSFRYKKDSEVFRYDNYHLHQGISSPFHHKHTSNGVIQLETPPNFYDIVVEAERELI
jgi:hypothetical protein